MANINKVINYAKKNLKYDLTEKEANDILTFAKEYDEDFEDVLTDYVYDKSCDCADWLTANIS